MPEPIPTAILLPDGSLAPTPYAAHSLAEVAEHEPQGVYTVARTFQHDRALLLDAHLDRMEKSARLVGIPLKLNRPQLRAALRTLIHRAGYPESRFRITVPRDVPEQVYLALEPLRPVPEHVMQEGAHVITVPLVRPNPVAKTTDWVKKRRPAYEQLPSDVYEGILLDAKGYLREGLSSNFYGVLEGTLHTAGEGVLEGITRMAVLELAPQVLPLEMTPVHKSDLPRLSGAMLTSSSRGLVPITRIDGQPVGDGRVGPITRRLQQLYDAWTEAHAEPI